MKELPNRRAARLLLLAAILSCAPLAHGAPVVPAPGIAPFTNPDDWSAGSVVQVSPAPAKASIRWAPFSRETFSRARAGDKPVFLFLTASWCPHCRVMNEKAFSDVRVIELWNRSFVPVRVDTDQNPPVTRRYLLGGWPTCAFLSPDGWILAAANQLSADELLSLGRDVLGAWKADPTTAAQALGGARLAPRLEPAPAGAIDRALAEKVASTVASMADPVNGGFGMGMKFPEQETLLYLLVRLRDSGDGIAGSILTRTLAAMTAGGIHDPVEGGFFRYADGRDWSAPHKDKRLDVNAGMLRVYAAAYRMTGKPEYLKVAQGIYRYLISNLWDESRGVFYAGQEADDDYYRKDLAARRARGGPRVDRTVLSGAVAFAASACLEASVAFEGETGYDAEARALRALRFVVERMKAPDGGYYHSYRDGVRSLTGDLEDQVEVGLALLEASEATGDGRFLGEGEAVARLLQRYYTAPEGGWRDVPYVPDAPGLLSAPLRPIDVNARASVFLLRLAFLTGNTVWRDAARATLEAFAKPVLAARVGDTGAYGLALERALHSPLQMVVVGSFTNPATSELLRAAFHLTAPYRSLRLLAPGRDNLSLYGITFPETKAPTLYVCSESRCSSPIRSAKDVKAKVEEFLRSAPPNPGLRPAR